MVKCNVYIPHGVEGEIKKCPDIYSEINSYNWLNITKISKSKTNTVKELQNQNFGLGESECIAIGHIIFMCDTKAGRYA